MQGPLREDLSISTRSSAKDLYRITQGPRRNQSLFKICSQGPVQDQRKALLEHPDRAAHLLGACAVEMHMDMSHGQLCGRICRKKAGEQMEHPDQAQALTLLQEPLSVTHCLGKKDRP